MLEKGVAYICARYARRSSLPLPACINGNAWLVLQGTGKLQLCHGHGDGSFTAALQNYTSPDGDHMLRNLDFNNDGQQVKDLHRHVRILQQRWHARALLVGEPAEFLYTAHTEAIMIAMWGGQRDAAFASCNCGCGDMLVQERAC